MEKEPMTNAGYKKITSELVNLKKQQRPETVIALEEARQLGDLKENAEYHAAKEKLALIDIQISEIGFIISKAIIVDPTAFSHTRVSFGSTVHLLDTKSEEEFTYSIVGGVEANVEKGLISFNSPLAKEVLGKEEGDELIANLPNGKRHYEILDVFYKDLEL